MIFTISLKIALIIVIMAFFAEYLDSSLGMGYGTTLTPLLMILFEFEPLQIVPAILFSEFLTGILAGFTHHSMGNVDLRPKTMRIGTIINKLHLHGFKECIRRGLPLHLKIAIVIALCSIIGTVISVFIAVNIPKFYLKLYIGILVLLIGIVIIMTMNRNYPFSWHKIIGLGIIASFNKGISGGGYGPVVTGGQLISGIHGKSAVGITSLAEGLTCLVGVIIYLVVKGNIDWELAFYLVLGGLISVPFSAITVKKMTSERLKQLIGVVTIILGTFTIGKILI